MCYPTAPAAGCDPTHTGSFCACQASNPPTTFITEGKPVRASGEESFDMVAPAMKVRDFNFTDVTRF